MAFMVAHDTARFPNFLGGKESPEMLPIPAIVRPLLEDAKVRTRRAPTGDTEPAYDLTGFFAGRAVTLRFGFSDAASGARVPFMEVEMTLTGMFGEIDLARRMSLPVAGGGLEDFSDERACFDHEHVVLGAPRDLLATVFDTEVRAGLANIARSAGFLGRGLEALTARDFTLKLRLIGWPADTASIAYVLTGMNAIAVRIDAHAAARDRLGHSAALEPELAAYRATRTSRKQRSHAFTRAILASFAAFQVLVTAAAIASIVALT